MEKGFKTTAIGVMSGTSLDGLDLCLAEFSFEGKWYYRILESTCVSYSDDLRHSLATAHSLSEIDLAALYTKYGNFIGQQVALFLNDTGSSAELICSHGHTVKHEPEAGITIQIGCGHEIANETGLLTICDFRKLDVSLGGQGAPLVPIGDKLLFSDFDACLNLGGFSNISFDEQGARKAFDICPVNIILNPLANRLGKAFDHQGAIARSGSVSEKLLESLNAIATYQTQNRPSLAREWLESDFLPVLNETSISAENLLRTVVEHVAIQIGRVLENHVKSGKVLITGGGAYNQFLIERISACCNAELKIPNAQLVEFKEALIFAFLGVLRLQNEINVLNSVTGASRDSSSGVIHRPVSDG